ncbi:MAG: DNA-binding protein [Hydrogenophaga sp.]|uniref:DNA-binding protein n=1 Tax=Hydrogenophaga sp. TaxID=1904254 RepID=UPI002720C9CD|nr:DNA-binding protein [Hydrogenophaga sp.]MDO9482956.1 DNA-binding protein [Hydrogenophaga sp.]MDP3344724.1 DNA-binding protein [Hydrogenophaga sp.]MDP3808114.1 DNA-binding protein [Hydrogenophaga sp.]MDP3922755.1 DNA-binding protein [Hydrogenophaga sp.]MDZ4238766.1 DNA-binding protein [Hydrogenophaga sp.]
MAINQERVNQVCEAMDAEGKAPTLAAVREALGEGSFSTLARMVKVWKAGRVDVEPVAVAVEVPEAVQAAGARMAAMVWAEAERLAGERLAGERADMEAGKAEMAAELAQVYAEMENMQELLIQKQNLTHAMAGREQAAEDRAVKAEREVQALKVELAALRGELDAYRAMMAKLQPVDVAKDQKAPGRKKAVKDEPETVQDTKTRPLEI